MDTLAKLNQRLRKIDCVNKTIDMVEELIDKEIQKGI